MKLTDYIDKLESRLFKNFDLYKDHKINDEKYDLFARYNLRAEKFFLTKAAKIYGMETNEYILVKNIENLDNRSFLLFTDNLISAIDNLVELHEEHMSSTITGVMLIEKPTEEIDNDILKKITNFKYHKGFSFGFKGWVDIRIVLVSLNDGSIITSKKGKEVREIYSINL